MALLLGISKNTLKTRIRLLPTYLRAEGIASVVNQVLSTAEMAGPVRPPRIARIATRDAKGRPLTPEAALADLPSAWHGVGPSHVKLPARWSAFAQERNVRSLHDLVHHPEFDSERDAVQVYNQASAQLLAGDVELSR